MAKYPKAFIAESLDSITPAKMAMANLVGIFKKKSGMIQIRKNTLTGEIGHFVSPIEWARLSESC